jgi:hypothetical protein
VPVPSFGEENRVGDAPKVGYAAKLPASSIQPYAYRTVIGRSSF